MKANKEPDPVPPWRPFSKKVGGWVGGRVVYMLCPGSQCACTTYSHLTQARAYIVKLHAHAHAPAHSLTLRAHPHTHIHNRLQSTTNRRQGPETKKEQQGAIVFESATIFTAYLKTEI